MSIESDIIDWVLDRPGWQQEVLVALAEGEAYDEDKIALLADKLLDPASLVPNKEAKKISLKSAAVQQIQLVAIASVKGVNALVDGQSLTVSASGITVVYGDNGSGKSGYARLIKNIVNARHASAVLPDVFGDSPPDPSADLQYTVDGLQHSVMYPAASTPETLKMSFYDEHCGDEYLTKQSVISYRPSALTLLDGLIRICDLVKDEISERLKANQVGKLNLNLPPQTTSGAFLVGLTASTAVDQIDTATQLAPGTNEALAKALEEEARLTGSDPTKEQARLYALAMQLDELRTGLTGLLAEVGSTKVGTMVVARTKAVDLRAAASLAATKSFEGESLDGVGSGTWRALWEAARGFSATAAYLQHDFPVIGDESRCVLCQQLLNDDAKARLQRFDAYMSDTTERDAVAAETAYEQTIRALEGLVVATPQRTTALAALVTQDEKLGNATQALLDKIEEQRAAVLRHLTGDAPLPPALPAVDLPDKIATLATTLKDRADATDVEQFKSALAAVSKSKDELSANVRLCESSDLIKAEVERLRTGAKLVVAKSATDTSAITQKASLLTRQHATNLILDQFTRETDRLRLERVTLEDLGGHKGQLNQKPGLLGAKHKQASARAVLSEGEQTALGLAGFFTEAVFDESKSAIIFDDPVTSLDHVRRDKVAERLAQLAQDRQVIVFTHDVAFTGDLTAAAEREKVSLTERSVERRGVRPGVCLETFPWKAKDFGSRLDHLRVELQKLTKGRPDLVQDDYEERVATWAGYLSETWERCVSTEIVNQVFDRGTSQVRTLKFRLLAKISDQDNQDLQDGYGSTSKWGRRHDKAPTTNYVAPEPEELASELKRLEDWQKRLKGYLKEKGPSS